MKLSVYSDEGKDKFEKRISSLCTDIEIELNPLPRIKIC
jgi:hypothetical protein